MIHPEKEPAVAYQLITSQTYVLKSGSDFACLTNDHAQRQP
jgi:hypothetical protein